MNPLPSIGDRVRTSSTVATLREPAFELLSRTINIQTFMSGEPVTNDTYDVE